MNPYHHPETAAAIWNVAMNAGLQRAHACQLLDLIEGVDLAGQEAHGQTIARSLEIVLSSVKMHEPMRRNAMWALARERDFARARATTRSDRKAAIDRGLGFRVSSGKYRLKSICELLRGDTVTQWFAPISHALAAVSRPELLQSRPKN